MAAARRSHRKRDWPRGLYETRPGYFVWREPGKDGKPGATWPLGRVPLAVARNEALAANTHLSEQRPDLVARLMGADHTVADLLDAMPVAENANTAQQHRSTDRRIRALWGPRQCASLTVRDIADELEKLPPAAAKQLRTRLVRLFRRGMAKGWMPSNPAEATERPRVVVKRGRLTLETFRQVRALCEPWMQRACDVALVLGCDESTLATLHRRMVVDGVLDFVRVKTKARVRVSLALRLDAAGLCLADFVPRGVTYFVHDPSPHGNAGPRVTGPRISKAFTAARRAAGLPDAKHGGPSFHEIRSLAKRLYDAQGNVDTLALLGHADKRTGDTYRDARDVAPELVRIA